jgi:hypothetical protein
MQYGDAVISDGAGEQNLVAGFHRARINLDSWEQASDARCGDVHLIGLAMVNNLRVATGDDDAGFVRGLAHGAHFGFEDFGGKTGFQNKGDDDGFGFGAGDGQVIYSAVDGQLTNGTAGKMQWFDDETVRGHGNARSIDLDVGGIAERAWGRSVKKRSEEAFD